MKSVDTIARVRREHFIRHRSIREISRDLNVSRNTVRKILRSGATEFQYEREVQPLPTIGPWRDQLDRLLMANEVKATRERLTLIRVFEELREAGFKGSYDAVRRYAKAWGKERGSVTADAYVPLSFAAGEAYQFDWSHEVVRINNATVVLKVAHVRLCHSRMFFARAYPRETQEMVFDAHDKAFAFFRGTCTRGIYDNMKTAVDAIFVGKDRMYNRRFLQMCSHYLIEPTACTPASGWEKGQVENQVSLVRERFFTPILRVKSLEELNGLLLDKSIAYAKVHKHPEITDQTIWQMFEAERPHLVPSAGCFNGFHASTAAVSKTCRTSKFTQLVPTKLLSALTTSDTPSPRAPWGGLWRYRPMLIVLSSVRMVRLLLNMPVPLHAAIPFMIHGIMCRFWRANRGLGAMVRRSRTGFCLPAWNVYDVNRGGQMTAIARW
jgi:transposase